MGRVSAFLLRLASEGTVFWCIIWSVLVLAPMGLDTRNIVMCIFVHFDGLMSFFAWGVDPEDSLP